MLLRAVNRLIFVCLGTVLLCGSGAAAESIMDQAVSSADVRRELITEYETSLQRLQDDRLLAVAISYAKEGKYTNAVPVYKRFLVSHPKQIRALRGLGTTYLYLERHEEAINYLRKSWSLGDIDSLSTLAVAYVRSGKYAQMEDLVSALVQHSQGDAEIVNCLIAYAIFYKDPPDAKLVLKALAGLRDQDILQRDDTTQLLSEVVARFGRDPALEMAQLPVLGKIIHGYEADPQKWPANRRTYVADSYCLAGQHTKGEPIYRELLKENPDDVSALRGLGIALAYQRKFTDGIAPLRKAWSHKDKLSLSALTACHMGARDFDGMKDLIPFLLERRKEDMESLSTVLAYSIAREPTDRELFFKAIDGFTDDELLRNQEVTNNTVLGLKLFGEKQRAERLRKLQIEQARGQKA
jgi:tetratricopeptide (TPR) repeat protein